MARHDTPSNLQELEELGAEAIIAQQTGAHLPQRRVQVAEEQRSVVIAEPSAEQPAAAPALKPFRHERGEKTIVIRDRRELDAARQKLVARQKRPPRTRALFYTLLAVAIVAGVAVGVFGVAAWRGATPRLAQTLPSSTESAVVAAPPAPTVHAAPGEEVAPRVVPLEALPIERKPSRR